KPILGLNEFTKTPFIGLVELMRLAHAGIDITRLGQMLIEKTANQPDDANTLMDLSTVLQLSGNRELALQMQAEAIALQRAYRQPVKNMTLQVLALMSAGDLMANTPIEFLLENSGIELTQFYVTEDLFTVAGAFNEDLPPHDVLFVAIAESEENLPLLKQLEPLLAKWEKPVLNKPEYIAKMSRDAACQLLADAVGIVMPETVRHTIEHLNSKNFDYPLIIRPVDSHAGHDLEKIESKNALTDYLERQRYNEFFVAKFVDYRNTDSLFRKYRVVLISGQPFLCHLAISEHWMIHYLNAGMAEDASKRAEEAQAMHDFDDTFAKKHAAAFKTIYERTGLDYLGIDCSETPDGELLIFEIDSCMIVHAIDPVDLFPYKPAHMAKLFAAFQRLLVESVF
ncbi:MAG: RimK family alpha-L-glutamate ligase, partial [Methylococcales bacterium]|nr:RimK family alpha-L-glutamate ligase [Methylococcales bacterium]